MGGISYKTFNRTTLELKRVKVISSGLGSVTF